jgi:hypothetical protein
LERLEDGGVLVDGDAYAPNTFFQRLIGPSSATAIARPTSMR